MYTLSEMATKASSLLNDSDQSCPEYNFTRWSKADLECYAQEAIALIFSLRPQKFISCKEMELTPGRVQKLPDGCTILTKVIGVNDQFGVPSSSIASNTDDRLSRLFPQTCGQSVDPSKYHVESFNFEESTNDIFYVDPPVPHTQEPIKVTVLCAGPPDTSSSSFTVESWMYSAVLEYMLYRAYLSEDESTNAPANASFHLEHFYAIIKNINMAEGEIFKQGVRVANEAS